MPAILVMLAVNVIQAGALDSLVLFGSVRIDLPLYLMVAVSLACVPRNACLLGFTLGLTVDLFQFGPFGLHALIYCVAGFVLADSRTWVMQDGASFRSMQGLVATLVVTGMTWMLGLVFGLMPFGLQQSLWGIVATLVGTGLLGALAIHPVSKLDTLMVDRDFIDRAPLSGSM